MEINPYLQNMPEENEMTNREGAEGISIHAQGSGNCKSITALIERALDEKDRFWSEKVVEAEKRGAERMRERAAKASEWLPTIDCTDSGHNNPYCKTCEIGHDAADLMAGKIRALPIDSETTGATEKRRGE